MFLFPQVSIELVPATQGTDAEAGGPGPGGKNTIMIKTEGKTQTSQEVSQQLLEGGRNTADVITHLLELSEQQTGATEQQQQQQRQQQEQTGKGDSDILQQALADSGLVQNKSKDASRKPTKDTSTSTSDTGIPSSDLELVEITPEGGGVAEEDNSEVMQAVAIAAANVERKREGYVTTMSVHDSATGTFKKHLIRKVGRAAMMF